MLDTDALEQVVDREMRAGGVPGLALAVVADGELEYARGFGVTSVEDGAPVTAGTLFRIASVTKVLTGTVLLRLVDAGTLELDRPVVEYLPWFRLRTPGAAEHVTLRMLLSHTSGLCEGAVEQPWRRERREPSGLAAFVREDVPRCPLVAWPGTIYSYSNLGVNVAGYVAEAVTGRPFTELVQELVLDPLDMRRTTFDPTVAMTWPLAQRHQADEHGRLRTRHDGGDNTGFYPSGYAFSTVTDMANLLILHMRDGRFGGRRLLAPESVAEMHTPHADVRLGRGLHYGITFLIEPSYKGVKRIGHEGVLRGFSGKVVLAPEVGAGVALFYNHEYNHDPRFFAARERIIDRIFDELLGLEPGPSEPPAVEPDRSLWPRLSGAYVKTLVPGSAAVRQATEGLVLDYGPVRVPLRPVARSLYVSRIPDRELELVPWPRTPYVIDDRVSVGFLLPERGPAEFLVVNGQPYRRQE